ELDEARRGLLIECVAAAVRGERQLVELRRTLPPDHHRRAFEQLQAHIARNVRLRLGDERIKSVAQRAEPKAVVDHLRPLLADELLEARDLFGEGDVLERLVRLQQQDGRWRLVDLTRLDADEPVLEMIDAAHAAFTTYPVERGDDLE